MQISESSADASQSKAKSMQTAAKKNGTSSKRSKGQKSSKQMRDEIDSW